jgi:hypothetical protein
MKSMLARQAGRIGWLLGGGCSAVLAGAYVDLGVGLLGGALVLSLVDGGVRAQPHFWLPFEPSADEPPTPRPRGAR